MAAFIQAWCGEMEKRDATRIVFKVKAIVSVNGRKIRGNVENLSMTGMFLVTPENLPKAKKIDVEISLSGSTSRLKVRIKGSVVRSDTRGIALHFNEMDLDSFIHLRNILASNEGDGDKIMKEFYESIKKH